MCERVLIPINGVKHWLWRAIDANGDTLDILVQTRQNAKGAKRFLARLIARFGQPRVVITPFRDIAAQCTVGQRTSCAVTPSRLHVWHQTQITGPTKALTSDRGQSSTDPATRENHGTFQVAKAGTTLLVRPRSPSHCCKQQLPGSGST